MTRPLIFIVLAGLSAFADPPAPVFAFAADSLTATVTRLGGKAPDGRDSLFPALPCDSAAAPAGSGGVAWFDVEVNDKRTGTDVRFPVDEAALRRGLRKLCQEEEAPQASQVASLLRGMASKLRVRMGGPVQEDGK